MSDKPDLNDVIARLRRMARSSVQKQTLEEIIADGFQAVADAQIELKTRLDMMDRIMGTTELVVKDPVVSRVVELLRTQDDLTDLQLAIKMKNQGLLASVVAPPS